MVDVDSEGNCMIDVDSEDRCMVDVDSEGNCMIDVDSEGHRLRQRYILLGIGTCGIYSPYRQLFEAEVCCGSPVTQ